MGHCRFKSILFLSAVGLALVGSVLTQNSATETTPKLPTTTTPPPASPAPPQVSCSPSSTKPKLQQNVYSYKTCIVAQFAAYFMPAPGQYVELKNGKVQNNSHCEDNSTQAPTLIVDFDCGELEFEMSKNNQSVFVKSINGWYGTNGNHTKFANATAMFYSDPDHYYKCNSEQTIVNSLNKTASLVLSNVAIEAFRQSNNTDFHKVAEDCPLDSSQVSDLVRIGVGVCLVALVALVLIAYFVGKRRWSERSSYESV